MGKAAYVRSQEQTRVHHCHWPGCDKQVPPAMWGCRTHWYALPAGLRASIWATYRPGQERNGTPSTEYLDAARAVQTWITQETAPPPPTESAIATEIKVARDEFATWPKERQDAARASAVAMTPPTEDDNG